MSNAPITNMRKDVRLTGAVYTPDAVANALSSLVLSFLPNENLHILEPSVGDGAFLRAFNGKTNSLNITAVDIDEEVVKNLRDSVHSSFNNIKFYSMNFINFSCDKIKNEESNYDLVIGNPPFIRKHNFDADFKNSLLNLSKCTHYPLSNIKNSWAAFLLASSKLINSNGVLAFILPYEMITVVYGQKILSYLFDVFSRIDLFVSKQKAFPEIDQDAIIFIGQKKTILPPGLFIQRVASLSSLENRDESEVKIGSSSDFSLELNSFLIDKNFLPFLRRIKQENKSISDYCISSPGVVTGANSFFIVKKDFAIASNIYENTVPILKKGSFSGRSPVFRLKDFDVISQTEPCRLLKISDTRLDLSNDLLAYIEVGESLGFNEGYKCRNRSNWYEVPMVERASGFFFKRSHEYPRICVNEANVFITDTAYGLRMKGESTIKGLCFSFYNSLTLLFSEINGRFYGGGVLELSPNEFKSLPLIYHEPNEEEFESFLKVHEEASGDIIKILDFGDHWLQKKMNFSKKEMIDLRSSWCSIRSHRLRHGKKR